MYLIKIHRAEVLQMRSPAKRTGPAKSSWHDCIHHYVARQVSIAI